MCQRKSFLVIKGKARPVWLLDADDHSALIQAHKLKVDEAIGERSFVRIEAEPQKDPFSQNRDDWKVIIDEENIPAWFTDERYSWESKVLDELVNRVIPKEIQTGRCGNLIITGSVVYEWLTSVGGYLYISADAKLPALTSVGNYLYIRADAKLFTPKLEKVGGKAYKPGEKA